MAVNGPESRELSVGRGLGRGRIESRLEMGNILENS